MIYQEMFQAGENPSEINVSSTIYLAGGGRPNGGYPRHLHLHYEAAFFKDVTPPYGKFTLNQKTFEVRDSFFVLVPPLCVHGFSGVHAQRFLLVQFTDEFLHKNASTYLKGQTFRLAGEMQENGYLTVEPDTRLSWIIDRFLEITPSFTTPLKHEDHKIGYSAPYEFNLNAAALQMVCELLCRGNLAAVQGSVSVPYSNLLYGVMSRIVAHPEQKLSMEEAANMACMSYCSFSRFFLQVIGYSYVDYCNLMRVHRAQELLSEPGLSSAEIADRLNFGSTSYFNLVFKRISGYTPTEYRDKLL